jgi:hypothetical protein
VLGIGCVDGQRNTKDETEEQRVEVTEGEEGERDLTAIIIPIKLLLNVHKSTKN